MALKLNPVNNTLNVSFLQVHAYISAVTFLQEPWGTTSFKLYLDTVKRIVSTLHITTHAVLHAKTCDTFHLLACRLSAVIPLQHLNYLGAAANGVNGDL